MPTVSCEKESGAAPVFGIRPSVGLRPVTPQSAAGIRIDPPVSVAIANGTAPRRDRRRGAARGAAGDPRQVPGVPHVAEVGIDAGRGIGERVEVEPAERDRPGVVQPVEHGRAPHAELEPHVARADSRRRAPMHEHVLVRVRDPVERSSPRRPLARRRSFHRTVVERDEAVHDDIDLSRPGGERLDDLDRAELTRADRRDELLDAERPDLGQPSASAASRRRSS